MVVAGINCSPNLKGHTGTLVANLLKGAVSAGSEILEIDLGSAAVGPCRACLACKSGAGCVCCDDMHLFYREAHRIDVLIIGTPIYFDHVSAQCKAFIDRFYAFIYPGLENHYPGGKRLVTAITYGDSNETAYDSVEEWLQSRMNCYFGFDTIGSLKRPGCSELTSVRDDKALMERAFELGRQIAGDVS